MSNRLQQSWQKDQYLQNQIQLQQEQHYNKKIKYITTRQSQVQQQQNDSHNNSDNNTNNNTNHNINNNNQTQKQQSLSQYQQTSPGSRSLTSRSHQPLQLQITPINQRKKFGNMIIFYQSKNWFLSLGPNYLFFAFAYLSFTIASIYLVGLVNSTIKNQYFLMANLIVCIAQNFSYLLVAFSNPGVVLPKNQSIPLSSEQIKVNRYCKTCLVIQQRYTYHCRQCNICISQYDHHCPWTSKCIGGGNLKRFYFFVIMTPFYIFYYMVAFMVCMANMATIHNQNLKTNHVTNVTTGKL